ncbi:hypothetical protein SMCF_3409, partial [Streptomyces coelicoflavus ZG0656]
RTGHGEYRELGLMVRFFRSPDDEKVPLRDTAHR